MGKANGPPPSRRTMLQWGIGAGAMAVAQPGMANHIQASSQVTSAMTVFDFGAMADGQTDNTSAFQYALDNAHKAGGGCVYAPPGKYLFRASLTIPEGVTLRGSFGCVPSHTGIRDPGQPKPGDDGTALFVLGGRGAEEGAPFLTLNTNSSVSGLTVYYPEQELDANPIPYPWTISMRGKNPAVVDVELLNSYQAIDASHNERHNIRDIAGQPLRRGIWVDSILDIGRIENVHFNPWWSMKPKLLQWQMANGEAFVFGRADWQYVFNTFCYAYKTGYKFIETADGACNGNFLGIGADNCNRGILVEQCDPFGLLIVNGEFTSFQGDDPTMVEVLPSNTGVVRISNSAFWGPCHQAAKVAGRGTVSFSGCTFVEWAEQFVGTEKEYARDTAPVAAIQAASGSLLVQGCEFRADKPHIALGKNVERAVISGNLFVGPIQIETASEKDVQIGLNATTSVLPRNPYNGG
jgi:Pectate lyase superfamily protein